MRALTPFTARPALWSRLCLGMAPLAALGACVAQEEVASSSSSSSRAGVAASQAGGSTAAAAGQTRPGSAMTGSSIATMAGQYGARAGATAGTGASAWVPAAPEPAFVATGPAPAPEARAAPPGAIANRQPTAQASAPAARPSTPAARPAVAASEIARPEAAQSDSLAPELQAPAQPQGSAQPGGQAQQASLSAADLAKGRQLFGDFSCGACHLLADAGGSGSIGPSLDRNPNLTREFAASVIHDGRGAMPSFAGQISDPDIATLAAYIVQVSRK